MELTIRCINALALALCQTLIVVLAAILPSQSTNLVITRHVLHIPKHSSISRRITLFSMLIFEYTTRKIPEFKDTFLVIKPRIHINIIDII
jgi:hypothetical protein